MQWAWPRTHCHSDVRGKGWVYLIERWDGLWKLGWTTGESPDRRCWELVSSSLMPMRLHSFVEVPDQNYESQLLRTFASRGRIRAEQGGTEIFDFRGREVRAVQLLMIRFAIEMEDTRPFLSRRIWLQEEAARYAVLAATGFTRAASFAGVSGKWHRVSKVVKPDCGYYADCGKLKARRGPSEVVFIEPEQNLCSSCWPTA